MKGERRKDQKRVTKIQPSVYEILSEKEAPKEQPEGHVTNPAMQQIMEETRENREAAQKNLEKLMDRLGILSEGHSAAELSEPKKKGKKKASK